MCLVLWWEDSPFNSGRSYIPFIVETRANEVTFMLLDVYYIIFSFVVVYILLYVSFSL